MRNTTWLWVASLGLSAATLMACKEGHDCPSTAACPDGATCRCDDQGRVLIESKDLTGDKKLDTVRYVYNARGAIESKRQDWADNGSIEREELFFYDAEGRLVRKAGFQIRCTSRERMEWDCELAEPCAPPFDACAGCIEKKKPDDSKPAVPCKDDEK